MNDKREELKQLIKKGYDLELISLELDIPREEIEEIIKDIKDEVKQLIESGYDLDLISFELEIPMELISECKTQKEPIKTMKSGITQDKKSKDKSQSAFNMQQLRNRYRQLYLSSNAGKVTIPSGISKEEIEFVNSEIQGFEDKKNQIKELLEKIPNSQQNQYDILRKKRKIADEILVSIRELKGRKMTTEQSERIIRLLDSNELQTLRISSKDRIDSYARNLRRTMLRKYAQSVQNTITQVTQLEDLRGLYRTLSELTTQEYEVTVESAKIQIDRKITKMQQEKAMELYRRKVPKYLITIVEDLASGTIDIDAARKLIEIETKKKMESGTKNRFSLTREQEKEQVLMRIKNILIENKYNIVDPENTILKIHELCGGNITDGMRVVIKNLIQRGEFKQARQICRSFSSRDKEGTMARSIRLLERDINSSEIGDFILKGINMKSNEESDSQFFNLIQKGLQKGNVSLKSIFLGKSRDGLRDITLADVWTQEMQIQI